MSNSRCTYRIPGKPSTHAHPSWSPGWHETGSALRSETESSTVPQQGDVPYGRCTDQTETLRFHVPHGQKKRPTWRESEASRHASDPLGAHSAAHSPLHRGCGKRRTSCFHSHRSRHTWRQRLGQRGER